VQKYKKFHDLQKYGLLFLIKHSISSRYGMFGNVCSLPPHVIASAPHVIARYEAISLETIMNHGNHENLVKIMVQTKFFQKKQHKYKILKINPYLCAESDMY
jgi:hypothetical protein